ncbi:MAG TPA: ABC transporter ATP-binding protein [bacterium]|nr:ABC transporter ATP-binding protein [bacterium]
MAAPLVEAIDVHYSWPTGPAVDGVDLAVGAGEMLAVVGPNGAGKSTLLRLLSGYLKPDRGVVRLAGEDIRRYGRREVARLASFVPQYSEVNLPYTVAELATLARYAHLGPFRPPGPGDRAMVAWALGITGMAELADRPVSQLSGGEFQRAVLARALAQGANLVFLDEPTAHLDISHQSRTFNLLARLNAEAGLTVVAVLHDLNLAAAYFPRVVLLARGRLECDGRAEDVFREDRLSEVYGCAVRTVRAGGRRFIFPEAEDQRR